MLILPEHAWLAAPGPNGFQRWTLWEETILTIFTRTINLNMKIIHVL